MSDRGTGDGGDVVMEAKGVCLAFQRGGVRALDGVSVVARRGGVTGLVGPDGAGKTTLLRLAAGLHAADEGRLRVLGLDPVRDANAIRTRVGYMPQQFGLYEDLKVRENLDFHADLQGVPMARRPERFGRLLEMTGLGPFTGRLVGRLSGGMKQKLGLACCLVKSPGLLLLDEPTVGVDPVSRRDLWEIVYHLIEREGIGVVLSTSYLDEAERCHHVVILHDGRKLSEGPPRQFREGMRGRVRLVTPAAGVSPRHVQSVMARQPRVIDATIRSGRVRVVFAEGRVPEADGLPAGLCAEATPAEPVFEDAFVEMLSPRVAKGPNRVAVENGVDHGNGTEAVVSVRDLSKRFGDFEAVRGIGFEVRKGEVFGLLGPNGAGKSTTFRMLCGLLPASGGRLRVAGRDLRTSGAVARERLGYMAQRFSLYEHLPVQHNLRFYGRAYGLKGSRLRKRLDWALREFGLEDRKDQPAGSLPGGCRQRLAMAAATLHEPDILFLDEPTSGADPLARREFWLRINGFAQSGVTVIVTTHFMAEAEYCDRMLIMSQGRPLALGTPHEIRAMARTNDNPDPTIEDAFIALAEGRVQPGKENQGG